MKATIIKNLLIEPFSNKYITLKIPNIKGYLARIKEINTSIKLLEEEKEGLDLYIRTEAKISMINLYREKKKFPGTLKFIAGKLSFLFIVKDKYTKIDEKRAIILKNKYGNDIVTENIEHKLNTVLYNKYKDIIIDFVKKSTIINNEDKDKLIEVNKTYSITKGVIKELKTEKYEKYDIVEIIEDIKPEFNINY